MATRQNTDYGYEIQKIYLEMMLTDAESFVRCQGVFDVNAFDRRLQPAAKFLDDYVNEHNAMPRSTWLTLQPKQVSKIQDSYKRIIMIGF